MVCRWGMDSCNDIMIWSKFRRSGYFTAYGEDRLPDTYGPLMQFKELPTDHYTRPLFLLGEKVLGNVICVKNRPSAHHVLDYAYQFVKTYKEQIFFGFFWLVSYSHDPTHIPTLLENEILKFFDDINLLGVLNNTIIIFLGDHGPRYGPQKIPVESYYDERLPMLYMKFPDSFRERHKAEFRNLEINQQRLTTHCDLHSTLWNILKFSDKSVTIVPPEYCPQCGSLFEEKPIYRRCENMEVSARWCSCNTLNEVDLNDAAATIVPQTLLYNLINETKEDFQIETVIRLHWFRYDFDYKDNITYYLIAMQMLQEKKQYEGVVKRQDMKFEVLGEIDNISPRDKFVGFTECLPV